MSLQVATKNHLLHILPYSTGAVGLQGQGPGPPGQCSASLLNQPHPAAPAKQPGLGWGWRPGLATTRPSSSTAAGLRPSWDGAGQDRASVKVLSKSLGLGRGRAVEQQGQRKFSFREEGGLHRGFTQLSSRLDTCDPSQDSYASVGGREWIFSGPWHVCTTHYYFSEHTRSE